MQKTNRNILLPTRHSNSHEVTRRWKFATRTPGISGHLPLLKRKSHLTFWYILHCCWKTMCSYDEICFGFGFCKIVETGLPWELWRCIVSVVNPCEPQYWSPLKCFRLLFQLQSSAEFSRGLLDWFPGLHCRVPQMESLQGRELHVKPTRLKQGDLPPV